MSTTINFSPFTSIFENKTAGTIIIGKPGAGKSFFLLNLAANALMFEQRLFVIDPKDDMSVLANIYDGIEVIDINDIKPGGLNPFKVIKDIDTNTLSSIVSIICGGLTDDQIIAITPILNDFINKNRRLNMNLSFSDVVDYLYANDNIEAQAIGTKLQIHRDSKYGPLLFENNETEETGLKSNSTIISLHGMDLPKGQSGSMTEEQKFNSAIVFIVCKMLKDVLTQGKYPTLFILDEAHIAYQNESFSRIIDELLVLGRSLNIAVVLASQSTSHYPEGISQLVSSKFCFNSSTDDATDFIEKFYNKDFDGMADFDSIVYEIGQFETGNVFFIDSNNRTGIFKVTSLLGDDITSNPLMKKRNKE